MTRDQLILAALPAVITELGFASNEHAAKGFGVSASVAINSAIEIADAYEAAEAGWKDVPENA